MKKTLRATVMIAVLSATACAGGDLEVSDFDFGPPLGCEGATIEKIGTNHFAVQLGHAPEIPGWANFLQFRILRHARGNALKLTVSFKGETGRPFHVNFQSWSYDAVKWHPIKFESVREEKDAATGARIRTAELSFPPFEQDAVWCGFQVPLTYQQSLAMIGKWKKNPAVTVHELGKSIDGRNLSRIEITDPKSPVPRERRWVHYAAGQHPGEYNAMWRMVGMIEWLLSDAGVDARRRFICHFVIMQCPDGPPNGWQRTNRQGIDMNRSYAPAGAFEGQGHEPYIFQKDLERIMASPSPLTTIWCMHTWPGIVELGISLHPDDAARFGPLERFAEVLAELDRNHDLIKPPYAYEYSGWPRKPWTPADSKSDGKSGQQWWAGPRDQFGITAVLCEGSAGLLIRQENIDSGKIIMEALSEYYSGVKSPSGEVAEKTAL